jgi:LPS-assembly protein
MLRICLLLILGFAAAVQAREAVQIYATHLESNATEARAEGDVLILFKDYYLSAKNVHYDRVNEVIELFGSVTMIKGSDYHILGEYARFDIPNDTRRISPFYMLEKKRQVWMNCSGVSEQGDRLKLTSGVLSGCDPDDPMWTLRFSSSDYNRDTKWLNLYNARIAIKDVPVVYLPYFGYSLDTTRRTGLLMPLFGLSGSEGLYYQQPIYIAPHNWWDLEFRPQIRTERGMGLYADLRFVDSAASHGSMMVGYFRENDDYALENSLANQVHYGINLNYENQNLLKEWFGIERDVQSILYADINLMNDIDYINLSENDNTRNATTSQVFSRTNLFFNTDDDYYGAYFKYFLDLEQENNDKTIQNLPTLQYHHYMESWLDDHLLYSFNTDITNYYRRVGITAQQAEADLPITVRGTLLDGYLDISYSTRLYGTYIVFDGSNDVNRSYDSGGYGRNTNIFRVGTSLTKGYGEFAHNVGLDVMFVRNGFEKRNGYFEQYEYNCTVNSTDEDCSFYNITDIDEETQIRFSQYLFDVKGRQLLYHSLSQSISSIDDKFGEMENEIEWQALPGLLLYSDTLYDHEESQVTKQLSSVGYQGKKASINLTHYYEDKGRRNQPANSSYLTSRFDYRYDDHYRYFATYTYDLENSVTKTAGAGFFYSKRCWDFGLRYTENNRPVLQSGGIANSIYDKYLYMTVAFKPIGGSEFAYQLEDPDAGQ